MNHYSHIKNSDNRIIAMKNYSKYGSFTFTGGSFTGDVVILEAKLVNKKIHVVYFSIEELSPVNIFSDCVCGHDITIKNNIIVSLDDNAKVSSNQENYIKCISDLAKVKIDIDSSLNNISTQKKINETLVLYAVRNYSGEYFRAKGYSGGGASWVNDINKAKIYGKTGGARGTITWFANNHPSYPTPDLIKLTVTSIEVMDETARVKKAIEKKEKSEAAAKEREAQRKLADAERNYLIAKDNLKKLKG